VEECIFSNLSPAPIGLPYVGGAILTCAQRVAFTFTPPCDLYPCSFDLTYLSVILRALPPSFLGPIATANVTFTIQLGQFHRNLPLRRVLSEGDGQDSRRLHASPSPNYAPYVDIQSTIVTAPVTVHAAFPELFTLDLTGLHQTIWDPSSLRVDGDMKLIITPEIHYDCHGDAYCLHWINKVPQQILWLLSQAPEASVPGACPAGAGDCIRSNATSFLMLPACTSGTLLANASVPWGAGRRELWADACFASDAWAGTSFWPSLELGARVEWKYLRPSCECRALAPTRRRQLASGLARALQAGTSSSVLTPNANEFFGRCDATHGGYDRVGPVPIVIADNTLSSTWLQRGGSVPVQLGSEYFLQYPSPCGTSGCAHALDSLSLPLEIPAYVRLQYVASLRVRTRLYVPALAASGFSAQLATETTVSLAGTLTASGAGSAAPFLPIRLSTGFVGYSAAGAEGGYVLGITFTLLDVDGGVIVPTDNSSASAESVIRWAYGVPVVAVNSALVPTLLSALPGTQLSQGGAAAFLPGLIFTALVDERNVPSGAGRVWQQACAPISPVEEARVLADGSLMRPRVAEMYAHRRLQSTGTGPAALDCPLPRTDLQAPFPLADNVAGGRMLTNRFITLGSASAPAQFLLVFPASCTRCNVYLKEAVLPLARSLGCPSTVSLTATLGVWSPGTVVQQTTYAVYSFDALRSSGFSPRVTEGLQLPADVAMMSLNLAATTGDTVDAGALKAVLPTDASDGSMLALRIQADGCLALGVGTTPTSGATFGSYSASGAEVVEHPVSVTDVKLLLSTGVAWKPAAELPGLYLPTVLVEPWEPECGTGSTPYVGGNSLPSASSSPARAGSEPTPTAGVGVGGASGQSSGQSELLGAVGAGGIAGIAIGAAAAAILIAAVAVLVAHRMRTAGPAPPRPVAAAAIAGGPAAGASASASAAPAGVAPRRSPLVAEGAARSASVLAPAASAPMPSTAAPPQPSRASAAPKGSSTGVQRVLSPPSRQRRCGGSGIGAVSGLNSP